MKSVDTPDCCCFVKPSLEPEWFLSVGRKAGTLPWQNWPTASSCWDSPQPQPALACLTPWTAVHLLSSPVWDHRLSFRHLLCSIEIYKRLHEWKRNFTFQNKCTLKHFKASSKSNETSGDRIWLSCIRDASSLLTCLSLHEAFTSTLLIIRPSLIRRRD